MTRAINVAISLLAITCFLGGCRRNQAPAVEAPASRATTTRGGGGPLAVATFAGGCFWCMEPPFEKLPGVVSVTSGYTGGAERDPSYKQVAAGRTGHAEAVQVRYDPTRISYEQLLEVFWRQIDPTDGGGQFADRGSQYRTAIFYHSTEQQRLAKASRAKLAASKRFAEPIVTAIVPAGPFYPAEAYHQDYYKKNPSRYKRYRFGSGREGFIRRKWGAERTVKIKRPRRPRYRKPSQAELRRRLSPLAYRVTQQNGTERPFANAYWNNKRAGIYVDIVSGEPLFSSRDKFKSGTGWPSFTRPLEPGNVVQRRDASHGMVRTEVRSKHADSHLGHLFDDGPPPTGQRYCINSAALRFIPAAQLESAGYGRYKGLFGKGVMAKKKP